jgi:hypothetical protein
LQIAERAVIIGVCENFFYQNALLVCIGIAGIIGLEQDCSGRTKRIFKEYTLIIDFTLEQYQRFLIYQPDLLVS